MDWVYVIAVLNGIAAILAWLSKIHWSRAFAAAKEAQIDVLKNQVEVLKNENQNLRDLTPMKLQEYHKSTTIMLSGYNDKLQQDLLSAKVEIERKNQQISQLESKGAIDESERHQPSVEKKFEERASSLQRIAVMMASPPRSADVPA